MTCPCYPDDAKTSSAKPVFLQRTNCSEQHQLEGGEGHLFCLTVVVAYCALAFGTMCQKEVCTEWKGGQGVTWYWVACLRCNVRVRAAFWKITLQVVCKADLMAWLPSSTVAVGLCWWGRR